MVNGRTEAEDMATRHGEPPMTFEQGQCDNCGGSVGPFVSFGGGTMASEHVVICRQCVESAFAMMGDRWIPVTERLPEKNANVLVWIPTAAEKTFIASVDEGGMWFSSDPAADGYSLGEHGAPTHWMPLPPCPSPPKESK